VRRIALILSIAALATLVALVSTQPGFGEGTNSITSPDTLGRVGFYASVALDSGGNPVVAYGRWGGGVKLLHCNDPNCSGDDESIAVPDAEGGSHNSLVLDSDGNPVVSYSGGTDLKVLHCNDPNCKGADESVTSPDTLGDVGHFASLALDRFGHPVVSYFDNDNYLLKVLHCNDPNCSGGDESITSPDTAAFGKSTSLALDSSGNPVVSYYNNDSNNYDLRVLHCNDPNCSGGDDNISTPDPDGWTGWSSSLTLDANGHPVISYLHFTATIPTAAGVATSSATRTLRARSAGSRR
jgi:hypothetical protein